MKRFLLFLTILLLNISGFSGQLVFIPKMNVNHVIQIIQNQSIKIHFYKDDFVIATTETSLKEDYILLDDQAFEANSDYFLVYCPKQNQETYLQTLASDTKLLLSTDDFIILNYSILHQSPLLPFKNDGMVHINNSRVRIPKALNQNALRAFDPDPVVEAMLTEVSGTNLTTAVQHLQDYGTRNCYTSQSVQAQNWLAQQFTDLGLSVEIMDFPMSGGSASDNVIATKIGSVYPDEYVICGSHYDSYSGSGGAPGADDNASGSAAVLEIARILSQYTFDRTIVFCTFSGEEYGLYGSDAYASRCADQNMNIMGYFNLDMIGYLQNGSPIHTDVIYPASAQELYDFYFDVCATYLPDFPVEPGSLSGGDSDHTSFNNNGFMGIFPFEDSQNYSPYIHTPNDLVGVSYNHEDQAVVFTKASLASVVTMANRLMPPQNLVALPGDNQVVLNWLSMPVAQTFYIYRDGVLIDYADANETSFTDNSAVNGTEYGYYITAIYAETGEESDPSNTVTATPMPPLTFPVVIDFENGTSYWEYDQNWGLSTQASHSPSHSLTESPTGAYDDNELSYATLRSFSLEAGYTSVELSFWNKFNLETGYDYMYFEITTDGNSWTILETFNGNQSSWQLQTYSLNTYLGEPYVQVRFRFYSDTNVTEEGMFIDDFSIMVEGGYQVQTLDFPEGWSSISSYISPVNPSLDEVFASLGNTLLAVQTMDESYIPLDLINTIGDWNAAEGYKIKLANPASLQIMGNASGISTVDVSDGWNLVPVLRSCDISVEDFMAVNPTVEIIKEVAGNGVSYVSENINGLATLEVGKSYLILVSAPGSLHFPDCTSKNQEENKAPTEYPYIKTGNSHILIIPNSLLDFCSVGDEIRAFDHTGVWCGSLLIENLSQPNALVVFGNDSLSGLEDGMMNGAPMTLRWFDSNQIYHDLSVTYDNNYPQSNAYFDQGISKLTAVSADMVFVDEYKNQIQIAPNPASGNVKIKLNVGGRNQITISASDGRTIFKSNLEKEINIDLTDYVKGIYTISIQTEQGLKTEKLMVR